MASVESVPVANTRFRPPSWAPALVPFAWLFVRLVLGITWLRAAWDKIGDAGWTAAPQGTAVAGFLKGAVASSSGAHPEVAHWFAAATNRFFIPNAEPIGYLVAYGELLIGLALILGLFTRLTAIFAALMNALFLLAGTSSSNPQMILLEVALVLAGAGAGTYGLDRWVLPWLGRTVGHDAVALARDAAIAVAVVFGAWLALVMTDSQTWVVMVVVAAGTAGAFEYFGRAVSRHAPAAPMQHSGMHG